MRVAATVLITGLLLAAPAVGRAEEPATEPETVSSSQVLPAELVDEPELFTPAADCQSAADPALAIGLPEPAPMAQNCGSCSTSPCKGVPRGTRCGSPGWWCNIYSGGFMCPTGGWECQCGHGPLP